MSTQRIYQLLVSFIVITVIALLIERSRPLAAIVSAMPINLALTLWFVYSSTGGDRVLAADFARMALFSLVPTMLFLIACWFALRRGWSLQWVFALGYGVWLVAVLIYRGLASGLGRR